MAYQDLEPVSKQLTIVVGLTVVGFMAFGLAVSFYRNVLFEQTLARISDENEKLRTQITQNQREIDYYRSTQYKDKYAKENLGRVNRGERVLIVMQQSASEVHDAASMAEEEKKRTEALETLLRQMPTAEHWRLYLFGGQELEELKASL